MIFLTTGGYLRIGVPTANRRYVCRGARVLSLPGSCSVGRTRPPPCAGKEFLVDAVAACMGIAIAWTVRRLGEGFAFRKAVVRVALQHDAQISDTDPTRGDQRNKVHQNAKSGVRSSARASIQASISDSR